MGIKRKMFRAQLIISFTIALWCFSGAAFSQKIQPILPTGTTEIVLENIADDNGPDNTLLVQLQSNEEIDKTILAGFPKSKNLPDSIGQQQVYTYFLDEPQYYFQGYRKGVFSSTTLHSILLKHSLTDDDTLRLSPNFAHCYFLFVTGVTPSGKKVYCIDTDGNDDFKNESIFALKDNTFLRNATIGQSSWVHFTYMDQHTCRTDSLPVHLTLKQNPLTNAAILVVRIPQYRFALVQLGAKRYFICHDPLNQRSLRLFEEKLSFNSLSASKNMFPNIPFSIGGNKFIYTPVSRYKIKLEAYSDQSSN